ncbi:putative ubiquitin-like protein atg12 [Diaporthe ampelina]|uniref:Ubiquitin-like protein ATG12 n=1 Tax=Diaporthe ampelina TaxID=1214573 RepID=A0A0G2F479_9PEZI|nr:putative ubiquitin-like protein atg12 [Diaporthe ampelina]
MTSPPRTPSSSSPAPAVAQGAGAGAGPAGSGPATPDIPPDQDRSSSPDLPLTMTASLVLTHLPRDAAAALSEVGTTFSQEKVIVRFKPVGGSAPPLPARRERSTISATSRFEAVVAYLRRTLKVAESDSLFLYVNSTFAPALDEVVGNLWRVDADLLLVGQCFKDSNDQLNVGYSMTPAFG